MRGGGQEASPFRGLPHPGAAAFARRRLNHGGGMGCHTYRDPGRRAHSRGPRVGGWEVIRMDTRGRGHVHGDPGQGDGMSHVRGPGVGGTRTGTQGGILSGFHPAPRPVPAQPGLPSARGGQTSDPRGPRQLKGPRTSASWPSAGLPGSAPQIEHAARVWIGLSWNPFYTENCRTRTFVG